MKKWDGHTHSQFCRHGSGESTVRMVERAIELGFERYSITEHAPLPPGIIDDPVLASEFTLLQHELSDYFKHLREIKQVYSGKIEVLSGLEFDYINGYGQYLADSLESCRGDLDDVLVSVHMIQGRNGVAPVDFTPESFESELLDFHGSVEEVHRVYWRDVEAMIHTPLPLDMPKRIGHLGLINKYIRRYPVKMDQAAFSQEQDRLFRSMKQKGWDLDYNVAGLRKNLFQDVYISDEMLQRCHAFDIRLVYGSDAHDVASVGQDYHLFLERIGQSRK